MEPQKDSKFMFHDGDKKPSITKYSNRPKFRPNDQVHLITRLSGGTTRSGPFTVSSVQNGKYTLIDENGTPVQNGTAIEENNLELVDPFA